MFSMVTNIFNQYKIYAFIGIALITILSIVFCLKYTYEKGYLSGKNETEIQLNKDYQVALENKLKEQKDILEKNFNVLLEAEQQKQKTKTVFIEREKQIKEITKADNFKVEMTEEQIKKLNELTRLIR